MATSTAITSIDTLTKLREKLAGLIGTEIPQVLEGSKTWDPPSVVDAASTTTTVTVTGAVPGQVALAAFPFSAVFTQSAYVSAADTVTVVIVNRSGGTVNLASGTLSVMVFL